MSKRAKEDVDYEPQASQHAHRCELCRQFLPLHDRCRLVAGEINPKGWCKLWERRT